MSKAVKDNYTALAEKYDRRWADFSGPVYRWVRDRLKQNPRHILDLGCGTAALIEEITKSFPDVQFTGVDTTPGMLDVARERCSSARFIEADLADIWALPFDECDYDVVMCLNVLHHLKNPAEFFRALHDALSEGTQIFICDFALCSPLMFMAEPYWRMCHKSHRKSFTPKQMRQMIEELGSFSIKDFEILKPDAFWRLQIYVLHKD